MTDKLSKEQRSANMRAVKNRDTAPEKEIRSLIHRMGYRFRLHDKNLPGKPDIVFPNRRAVILIHGCFWHGHHCKRGKKPRTNSAFWQAKLIGNAERDKDQLVLLKNAGWRSLVIWECQLKDKRLAARITRFLGKPGT